MSTHNEAMLDLVATYAVGAIDATAGECADVRRHIAECDICAQEFKIDRAATAALALSAAQAPPPHLRERILSTISGKVTPIVRRRQPSWLIPLAAAAVVVIAAGLWWRAQQVSSQPSWVASCVPNARGCHAHGTVTVAGRDHMLMRISGLAALPAGKQYQAWVIPPGGKPRPEPVFSPADDGTGSVDIPEPPVEGAVVAVTVEPTGGSQQPTSQPFLVATI